MTTETTPTDEQIGQHMMERHPEAADAGLGNGGGLWACDCRCAICALGGGEQREGAALSTVDHGEVRCETIDVCPECHAQIGPEEYSDDARWSCHCAEYAGELDAQDDDEQGPHPFFFG